MLFNNKMVQNFSGSSNAVLAIESGVSPGLIVYCLEDAKTALKLSLALTLRNKFLDSLNLPATLKSGYKKLGVDGYIFICNNRHFTK